MRHWLLSIALLLVTFVAPHFVSAAPATIDTSSSASATANSSQRKTFFDTQNETHWAFYYNGTAIEYSYSADGESWTSAGTLPYNTASFSAVYKTIAGTSYVFVVAEANTYDIVLRRGVLDATSATFDAEQTVFDGTSASNLYIKPTIAISENGHLWFSAIQDFGISVSDRYNVAVRRSTNLASGALNAFGAETPLGKRMLLLNEAVILPRNDDEMYVISSPDGNSIVGYTFDGSQWSDANTGGDYSWFVFPTSDLSIPPAAVGVLGSDVYIGGSFTNVGGNVDLDYLVRWDGAAWNAVGSVPLNGVIYTITVSGTDIYVGGEFTDAGGNANADRIARWDTINSTWNALGVGFDGGAPYSIAVSGTDVYAGGSFTNLNGDANMDNIAKFDGANWSALGTGASSTVDEVAISGGNVYIAGSFQNVAGIAAADRIAKWNGAAWSALGTGISGGGGQVWAMTILGTDIYVGGNFGTAGGVANTARLARWNGTAWKAVIPGLNGNVFALASGGNSVYISGGFTDATGDSNADGLIRLDTSNSTWHAVDTGLFASSITISGTDVYFLGSFTEVGGENTNFIVRRDTTNDTWHSLKSDSGINGLIRAITVSGSDVYIGGYFSNAGGILTADNIARWDGNAWHALGTGTNETVNAICVSGDDVYVGGVFTAAGGVANTSNIARWNISDNAWYALGSGIVTGYVNPPQGSNVYGIAAAGANIYVVGDFADVGGVAAADNVARWDGAAWNALGSGLNSAALAVATSGTDVYVGGNFSDAGAIATADGIARWDGAAWNALGAGLNNGVLAIVVSGTDVYVGGYFTNAGGIGTANRIARWDGSAWNALGSGINGGLYGGVYSIAIADSNLYVVGDFTNVAGIAEADGIAKWSIANNAWSAVGSGIDPAPDGMNYSGVQVLAASGSKVFVGGGGDLSYPTIINGIDQIAFLAYYGPAIATDVDATTEISAISDSDGNVYVSYTNDNDQVRFRRFDDNDARWGDTVTLNATTSSSPSVTYKNNDGRVITSWVESNAVSFRHAVSPYANADWEAETTFYGTGTNAAVTVVGNQDIDDLQLVWTNGAANPYSIFAAPIDMSAPTVAITSSATSSTNVSPIPVVITFNKDVTGFVVGDITVGNGTAGNFVAVDGMTYTADITPTGQGAVTVDVAGSVVMDVFANNNIAATQFTRTYDTVDPGVTISSGASNSTNASPFSVTFQFDENVTGFALGDVTVGNATAGNFVAVDGDTYTADITPTAEGAVTVDVAGSVAQDAATNDNTAATQFSITYDSVAPAVSISSTATSPTPTSPIPVDFEFSESVTGFVAGDITVTNGTVGSFIAVDGDSYTANILPTRSATITVNVAAAAAIDSANNPSAAATQFSIVYDAPNSDSDGDGVSDNQEAIDGTNPLDSGSYLALLPTSWCSDWNGYFGMYNVNEYTNLSSSNRQIIATLFDINGEAQSATGFSIGKDKQTDLLVHELDGWQEESYGEVCSEVTNGQKGDIDGRMVYYKPNASGFDFAFALPYQAGLRGSQFATFNTMQPSLNPSDSENNITNWIQLTNLEETAQRGSLIFYGFDGEVLASEAVTLATRARRDFSTHQLGSGIIGTVEWRPQSNTAKFVLINTRYFYDNSAMLESFDGAVQLEGMKGNGEKLSTLLDTRNQTAVLEVANTIASTITAAINIYDASGARKNQQLLTLAPHASLHIVANQYLNEELGSATINGNALGSILAIGMHYGRSESGGIGHSYGLIARQALGTIVHGSYNTYLGQGCELLLLNTTSSTVNSTVSMKRLDATPVLTDESIPTPAFGSASFNVCAEEEVDQYGIVTVVAGAKNAITPVIIRSGANGDYRFVTPLR